MLYNQDLSERKGDTMSHTLIPSNGKHPQDITPKDISLSQFVPLRGSDFRQIESEEAAELIVRFYQQQNRETWGAFTLSDLHDFGCPVYTKTRVCHNREMLWHLLCFESLVDAEYIIPQANDTWALTVEFIDICKRAADHNKR
jgi:hypothetical protein